MLAKYLEAKLRVLLVSGPGMGKTARIHAVAAQCGYNVVVLRASISDRVDFGGALVPDLKYGITREVPLEKIANLINSTEPTVFFIDDLGQAPIEVQAALMRFFDEGTLPDNVVVWAATNRPKDKAGVMSLCEPLRSRFDVIFEIPTPTSVESPDGGTMLCDWKQECASWCEWAISASAPPEVIAWHRSTTGRTLYLWQPNSNPALRMPDYRTWESLIKSWNLNIRDSQSVSAIIGKPTMVEFMAFVRLADQLPTPDEVRLNPKGAKLPTSAGASYLIMSMLSQSCIKKDINAFAEYACRLDRVYAACLFRDMHRKLGALMSGNPFWVSFLVEDQELLSA